MKKSAQTRQKLVPEQTFSFTGNTAGRTIAPLHRLEYSLQTSARNAVR